MSTLVSSPLEGGGGEECNRLEALDEGGGEECDRRFEPRRGWGRRVRSSLRASSRVGETSAVVSAQTARMSREGLRAAGHTRAVSPFEVVIASGQYRMM